MAEYAIEADLRRAFETLRAKARSYAELFDYYDGRQPLRYSMLRLAEIFRRLDVDFRENWCGVVVDAVKDRLQLRGWQTEDPRLAAALAEVWDVNDMELDADEAHEAALIAGESFLIAWTDDAGAVELYHNDPRQTHLFYRPEAPKRPWYGAKQWVGEDERLYLTLYYPDRFEHYRSRDKAADVSEYRSLSLIDDPEPNETGVIPLFHLRRKLRTVVGEITPIKPLQDRINKLAADMMVGAEFHALPQRYAISAQELSEEDKRLVTGLNRFLHFPAGDGEGQATSVGAFPTSDLRNFLDTIAAAIDSVAAISRTPKHYFVTATGADISGEALVALEAPLIRKADQYRERFGATWQNLGAFVAFLLGRPVGSRTAITPVWDEVHTPLPITESQVLLNEVNAGLPLTIALERRGWTQDELDKLTAALAEQRSAEETSLASAMLRARAQFDSGGLQGE